jgi:CarboxypepD_reg-like domain/TonB dependent receptor/TonB-dependent Receptor Plug Domain
MLLQKIKKMKNLLRITTIILVFLTSNTLFAQNLTQTIKGTVSDKAIKSPLIGANVALLNTNPLKGAAVDEEGHFKIENVPVGKHSLKISFIGYKDIVMNNIVVNSGKELDLNIDMEENAIQGQEVVIKAKIEKQKALNELSAVSTRTFSVEETQRFAAAVNDPARMATAYAGVVSGNDGNNTIVIRGNSPNGLLWRMEGVDIPNPNHFSAVGTSGGGISILSAQLLSNSDFSTGAFAAEYGNALSGVFDLKLRRGNSEKREYTVQAGVLGLDVAAEGPLSKKQQKGSYLINYRYSTLGILSKLGVNIGDAKTTFQDLSFNFTLPTEKYGNFTLFGFGGLSNQTAVGKADSIKWKTNLDSKYGYDFKANTGAMGLTHSLIFKKSYLKTVLSTSATDNISDINEFQKDYSLRILSNENLSQRKYTLSSVYNYKINAQHLVRIGQYFNFINYNFTQKNWENKASKLVEQINNKGNTTTSNNFVQWQYRPTEALTLNTGLHVFSLDLNQKTSIEPRVSAKYAFSERQSISVGYGLHSQMQPLGVYFYKTKKEGTQTDFKPNENLDFTKAHHFVLAFDQMFQGNWHIKAETYYQNLYKVPISKANNSTLSMLNLSEGFIAETFENKGTGRNYGLELTVEKFLTDGFYFLLSSSLYDSKYKALDGKWYNTRYNGNIANSLLMGKEWSLSRKNRTFGVNLKLTHMGGTRRTPIDLAASKKEDDTVFDFTKTFSTQMPYYMRADAGVRLKRNYKRMTTTLSLDIQNVTNRQNVFNQYFDTVTKEVKYGYQAPLIPLLAYKVEF